jgi:hypothetical protein
MRRATGRWLFLALLASASLLGCAGRNAPPAPQTGRAAGNVVTITGSTVNGMTTKDGRLIVNGRSYGAIKDGDTVDVSGGQVKVNGEIRAPADE